MRIPPLVILFACTVAAAEAPPPSKSSAGIAAKVAKAHKLDGFFPLYWDDAAGKLWLEIGAFDRDLLFVDGLNEGGALTQSALLTGLGKVNQFTANGMVAADDPAHKKPPTCYLIVDVKDGKFVRDATDPPTGFNCKYAPNYYFSTG